MSDERDVTTLSKLFLGSFLAGGLLFALLSCGTLLGAGADLKEAAPWIPPPYGTVADIAGTVLLMFGGHKIHRHLKKRRAAKAAKGH